MHFLVYSRLVDLCTKNMSVNLRVAVRRRKRGPPGPGHMVPATWSPNQNRDSYKEKAFWCQGPRGPRSKNDALRRSRPNGAQGHVVPESKSSLLQGEGHLVPRATWSPVPKVTLSQGDSLLMLRATWSRNQIRVSYKDKAIWCQVPRGPQCQK